MPCLKMTYFFQQLIGNLLCKDVPTRKSVKDSTLTFTFVLIFEAANFLLL